MIEVRPFQDTGRRQPWLAEATQPFLFRRLSRRARMGLGALRVWNGRTRSRRKSGFPPHSHADMEIITYVRGRRDHP